MADPFFEMGVAVRVLNHGFRLPTRRVDTFRADEAAGQTILSVDGDHRNYAQRGDTVLLGESSDTVDAGKTETGVIASVQQTTITLKVATVNIYDEDDPLYIYGSKFPSNWTFAGATAPVTIQRLPEQTFPGGFNDRYAAELFVANSTTGTFKFSFDSLLVERVEYRCGFQYNGGSGVLNIILNDGSSNIINDAGGVSSGVGSTWTRYVSAAAGAANTLTANGHFQIELDTTGGGGGATWQVDDVFVEHAEEINASGHYVFTELPERAYKYGRIADGTNIPVSPGLIKRVGLGYSDKSERMWFSCVLPFLPQADWDALRTFDRWQQRGNLINLHTYITDLPGVMTGFLEINELGRPVLFDQTKRRVQLDFVEAVL